jgi:hypothetical protein
LYDYVPGFSTGGSFTCVALLYFLNFVELIGHYIQFRFENEILICQKSCYRALLAKLAGIFPEFQGGKGN